MNGRSQLAQVAAQGESVVKTLSPAYAFHSRAALRRGAARGGGAARSEVFAAPRQQDSLRSIGRASFAYARHHRGLLAGRPSCWAAKILRATPPALRRPNALNARAGVVSQGIPLQGVASLRDATIWSSGLVAGVVSQGVPSLRDATITRFQSVPFPSALCALHHFN